MLFGLFKSIDLKSAFVLLVSLSISMITLASDALNASIHQSANPSENMRWQPVSKGTATWMWVDIYDAKLYAKQPVLAEDFLSDVAPLRLSLCYRKSITPDIFIKGASEVLPDNLSPVLQAEVTRLHQSYQKVQPGDCYDLEYLPEVGTQLKLNDKVLFHSNVSGFKAVYFGIWLGVNPLSKALKVSLVGK